MKSMCRGLFDSICDPPSALVPLTNQKRPLPDRRMERTTRKARLPRNNTPLTGADHWGSDRGTTIRGYGLDVLCDLIEDLIRKTQDVVTLLS